VGKSSLFNALMEATMARAENFPFCTIEPNIGVCSVPDERLDRLGALHNSERVLPTSLRFVDVSVRREGRSDRGWREEEVTLMKLAVIYTGCHLLVDLLLLFHLTSEHTHKEIHPFSSY
jgi:hypothetical protein